MYFLIDIGGTKTRISYSHDGEFLRDFKIFPTFSFYEEEEEEIKKFVNRFASAKITKVACVGIAGVLDSKKEKLTFSPNLPLWVGKEIKKKLKKLFPDGVFLRNDAELAGLGEAIKGAGKDFSIVSYITVGTGVGGARIVDKRIDSSNFGFEPGHQIIDIDKSLDGESFELEHFISASGIKKRLGKDPHLIEKTEIEQIESIFAAGLANSILHWSPEAVVVGGGLVLGGIISLGAVEKKLKTFLKIRTLPKILRAKLGEKSAIIGGLEFLKQHKV